MGFNLIEEAQVNTIKLKYHIIPIIPTNNIYWILLMTSIKMVR